MDMEQNAVKEVPYGISDFRTIVEQNIYYVDKTMYIPMLEKQARNLFSSALAVSARVCSLVCSMPIMTFVPRISSNNGLVICG